MKEDLDEHPTLDLVLYLLSGFMLAKQYSVNNARLVLKVSVFYLPILFLTIMVDKLT